jgi:hypothetical protein
MDAHLRKVVLSVAPHARRVCQCPPDDHDHRPLALRRNRNRPPTPPGSDSEDSGDDTLPLTKPFEDISIRYLCSEFDAGNPLPTSLVINFRDRDTMPSAHITARLFHVNNWRIAMTDKTAATGYRDLDEEDLDDELRENLKTIRAKVFYVSGQFELDFKETWLILCYF